MEKIINRRKYDTESAVVVGRWSNGKTENPLEVEKEELYRKANGEFFLYGSGGGNTKYAVLKENHWYGSEQIIPLSYDSAYEWAKEHLEEDEYEPIFKKKSGDGTKKTVTFSLPVSTIEKLKRIASQNNIKLSKCVENLIDSAE